jgi:hypothetical protein
MQKPTQFSLAFVKPLDAAGALSLLGNMRLAGITISINFAPSCLDFDILLSRMGRG